MSRTEAESKPPWSAVPRAVQAEAERIAGAGIIRATGAYGGYAPSATFRLRLGNGRRAFLKSTYPLPPGSAVRWSVAAEERVYRLEDLDPSTIGPAGAGRPGCR